MPPRVRPECWEYAYAGAGPLFHSAFHISHERVPQERIGQELCSKLPSIFIQFVQKRITVLRTSKFQSSLQFSIAPQVKGRELAKLFAHVAYSIKHSAHNSSTYSSAGMRIVSAHCLSRTPCRSSARRVSSLIAKRQQSHFFIISFKVYIFISMRIVLQRSAPTAQLSIAARHARVPATTHFRNDGGLPEGPANARASYQSSHNRHESITYSLTFA